MSFPECKLPILQEFILIKMSHDIWNTLAVLFLTIDIPIEVAWFALNHQPHTNRAVFLHQP